MKSLIRILFLLLFTWQLLACANTSTILKPQPILPPTVTLNHALFNSDQTEVSPNQPILELTEKQQQIFLANYQKRIGKGVRPDQALAEFLQSKLSSFTYYGETYDAKTAMRLNKGNCMSLAMLSAALAKIAGLEFDFIEVNSIPIFDKQGSLITAIPAARLTY
ncbi:MAG: hypothetical protein HAW66_08085 [Shewanella sp.]|nr:hypothetical protein [Shewanella sp.]